MRKQIGKIRNAKKAKDYRRKLTIRKKIIGSSDRPRICATKTNKNLFVQVIDDSASKTLFSVQTFGKSQAAEKCNIESAKKVGASVAEKMKSSNITTAVFDRNGKKYTGIIAALADSIRENGIQI